MTTRALLLAGGLGTRLRPLTETTPKCLIEVAGKRMLEYWVDALNAAGVSEALLNTHHHATQVRDYIAEVNARGGVQLVEAFEPELLGSAGTVHANRTWAQGEVVVIYADNLSDIDLGALTTLRVAPEAASISAIVLGAASSLSATRNRVPRAAW